MITAAFARHFADDWIASWNAHDLSRILSHYVDDFEMRSPRIVEIAGEPTGTLRGKEKVGAYWAEALRRQPDLRFELLTVLVDSIALHYRNQAGRLAVEVFELDEHGAVTAAAAHYSLPSPAA